MSEIDLTVLEEAKADFLDAEKETNWFVFGYSDSKEIELKSSGAGGWEEFVEAITGVDGISFGLTRMQQSDHAANQRFKSVLVTWVGPSATRDHQTLILAHAGTIKEFLAELTARNKREDLKEETVIAKVKKATGADYDSGSIDKTIVESTGAEKKVVNFSRPTPRGGRRLMRRGGNAAPPKKEEAPQSVEETPTPDMAEEVTEETGGDEDANIEDEE